MTLITRFSLSLDMEKFYMIYPPQHVKQILRTLQSREHQAFLVGGCVRDMLLDIVPQDWDICTSALPSQIMELFPGSRPTGIQHGTVTVVVSNHEVEVTTFRKEDQYQDHRHPDNVSFVSDLTTDLSRRDFTINAMAVSSEGDLVDPFYGMDDLNRRVIRCVGDPDIRFNEDALRMYRALRFSARYDFSIDELTKISIRKNAASAQYLAAERIRDELQKILQSDHTDRLNEIAEMHLLDRFCTTTKSIPDFTDLSKLKKHAHIRWAGFCHLLKHAGWIQSASQFLHALRMDNRTIKICSTCSLLLDTNPPDGRISWKKALSKYGTDSVECAAMITDWLQGTKYQKEVSSILRSGECFSLKFLAIDGKDLMERGYSGPVLGEMLQFLLDYVIEHPEKNKRELLIQLAGDHEET